MIIAIDLGSTSFKAAVFDRALGRLGTGTRRLVYLRSTGGGMELTVDVAREAVHGALLDALADARVDAAGLSAVGITSQAQTFTVLDADGQAKRPFLTWQDGRATAASRELAADASLAGFREHSGFHSPSPALQISLLAWLRRAEPDLVAPDDAVVHLAAFVLRELSGQSWTDDNLAAMSGLYSLKLRDYWPAALRACDLRREQLPRVTVIGTSPCVTSERARDYGVPAGIPIVCAGNDQTAGAYGAGIHESRTLLVTLGTAQVAYVSCDVMPLPKPGVIRGVYPEGRFYRLAVAASSGSVVTWAARAIEGCRDVDDFFRLAAEARPGAGGLVFDVAGAEGRWRNVGKEHTPADFARAVLEVAVRSVTDAVGLLDVDPRRMPVSVAGGGSRSTVWVEILAKQLGTDVTVVDADPLLGAARMASSSVI